MVEFDLFGLPKKKKKEVFTPEEAANELENERGLKRENWEYFLSQFSENDAIVAHEQTALIFVALGTETRNVSAIAKLIKKEDEMFKRRIRKGEHLDRQELVDGLRQKYSVPKQPGK